MVANVGIMTEIWKELEFGTEMADTPLYNIFTKQVVPPSVSNDIVERDVLGEKMCSEFISERLIKGIKSVWEPMRKSTVATFLSTSVPIDPKKNKLKNMKEDCNWFQRFAIASRSRPDLDLKAMVSQYEFGGTPRSLFAPDGNLIFATDKSKIVHNLEAKIKGLPTEEIPTTGTVLIIDGMALLHKVKKGKDIVTCTDLSDLVVNIVDKMGVGYEEVHLVMDQYLDKSLKNQTRSKRGGQEFRQVIINPKTNIKDVAMKELLSNTKTKRDLVTFLCDEAVARVQHKKFWATYDNATHGNFPFNPILKSHSQEEADTVMILHASTVHKSKRVVVDSPDTDVLLLLIHYMTDLPNCVVFRTGCILNVINRKFLQ